MKNAYQFIKNFTYGTQVQIQFYLERKKNENERDD